MCGIAGAYSSKLKMKLHGVEASVNLMRHRGPDDEGYITEAQNGISDYCGADTVTAFRKLPRLSTSPDTQLILAFRRLSIIDLTPDGRQPIVSKMRDYAMVFNGEIFNYLELKAELENEGCIFQTRGDAEVALQAWIRWGKKAFSRFNGMWAIAIWNQRERKLLLTRDRFGVKPLYLTRQRGAIYFASEMKTLLAWPSLSFEPDTNSIHNYLQSCTLNHDSSTFWKGIEEIAPSSWMEIDSEGRETVGRYWSYEPQEVNYRKGEVVEKFRDLFEDSLRLRMRSDVEVGALLSGGLDSNTIIGGLQRLGLIRKDTFKTFSAVFDEEIFSEEKYIMETLNSLSLNSFLVKPDPNQIKTDFARLLHHIEEPFRSLSVYSQYKIYDQINKHTKVKVVLNGQGADEIFGGYSVHYFYLFAELISRCKYFSAANEMKRFSIGRNFSFGAIISEIVSVLLKNNGSQSFSQKLFSEVTGSPLREYLKYDDRNSMSASIEARTPFLDYRMVEFGFSIPSEFKISNFENKKIIRQYARGLVPDVIIDRKDKMGFISPQEIWQKRELLDWFDETFQSAKNHRTYFQGNNVYSLYQKYKGGQYPRWDYIWRHFCLIHWLGQHGFM